MKCAWVLGLIVGWAPVFADPLAIIFPYEYRGNIDQVKFNEPSGLVFHPGRGTIFAVGDNGDLLEMGTDGQLSRPSSGSSIPLESEEDWLM